MGAFFLSPYKLRTYDTLDNVKKYLYLSFQQASQAQFA